MSDSGGLSVRRFSDALQADRNGMFRGTMFAKAFNDVVRLAVACTPADLGEALSPLPHGVRYGVACDLDEGGRAHRYDPVLERAYYISRHEPGFAVWRWNHVASDVEAGRLLALVLSLGVPLNGDIASRLFTQATRRAIDLKRGRHASALT